MSFFGKRANDALNANPNTFEGGSDISITVRGSDWYWAVCAVMTIATISFIALANLKPRRDRIFFYITAGVTMVASIAYFTMGANLGWVPIDVEYQRSDPRVHGVTREIFYVRYIDWVITTPLLLMDLLLTAGAPWPTILFVILVDEVMIIVGLVGALVVSSYKWAYFTFGCVALVYIVYQLVWEARRHAIAAGKDIGRVFTLCGSLTTVLWIVYPIVWGVCEGGNIIAPDSEAVAYGILDLLAKPVFGALLIWGHWGIAPERLGLAIRDYDEKDFLVERKHDAHPITANNGHSNGHTNGAANGTTNGETASTAV